MWGSHEACVRLWDLTREVYRIFSVRWFLKSLQIPTESKRILSNLQTGLEP